MFILKKNIRICILGFVYIYIKILSKYKRSNCIFYPSCSNFFYFVLKKHFILKSILLIIVRLAKCNVFFKGGFKLL